jgi:formylglycine-generating enzyme required for sulfatase activity
VYSCMKSKLIFAVFCCVCAALPLAAQTAAPENAERKRDSAQPQEMALIPAGKFWVGRSHTFFFDTIGGVPRDRMDDIPANNIYLDAFYIDKYEVTNADYARFVETTGARAPWHWPEGKMPKGEERIPVYNVNWYEAGDYCKSLGKRLPTEAEWEKAARGGLDRNRYSWGDAEVSQTEANLFNQGGQRTTNAPVPAALNLLGAMPVGSFAPNGYGLYDIIGNVGEWTNDWYDSNYYPFMPKVNPRGPETGRYKSTRGAGWADPAGDGDLKMVSYRNFSDPDTRSSTIGFRCAK